MVSFSKTVGNVLRERGEHVVPLRAEELFESVEDLFEQQRDWLDDNAMDTKVGLDIPC